MTYKEKTEMDREQKTESVLRCLLHNIDACIKLGKTLTINSQILVNLEHAYNLTVDELKDHVWRMYQKYKGLHGKAREVDA